MLPLLLENSPESIVVTDVEANIVYANPRFCALTGYRADELIGRNPRVLKTGHTDDETYRQMWRQLSRGEPWRGTFLNRKKNGEAYWEDARILPVRDETGLIVRYLGIKEEISERLRMQEKLARLVHYDALTGLANRERLGAELSRLSLDSRDGLLLFCIDLDGFGKLAARLGALGTDALICELADGLAMLAGEGGVAARLGDDEFALLANASEGARLATAIPELLATLTTPLFASIGEARLPASFAGQQPAAHLVRHAMEAMHAAKHAGGNRLVVYGKAGTRAAPSHCPSRDMLKDGSLILFYQPIVHADGSLAGAEALLRRRRPDGIYLPPADVLATFAADGIECELDLYVLAQALSQIVCWLKAGRGVDVSVNLHAQTLQSPGFVDTLASMLEGHGLSGAPHLTLEILEGVALTDLAHARKVVSECRALGVGVAIDDFGSAYASLGYLRSLPVTRVKLERTFVQSMFDDEGARVIVESVHALVSAFGAELVAEGVETERHAQHLATLGPMLMQGYAFAHPMAAADFESWRASRAP
ncbi:EAL domain-containing protein [Crenobacter caeni]|uniref:EAL domain-containing protein n=1 Tax=Crenobacter caeni TaxID=2705474 RepID=UPI0013D66A0B